MTSSNQRKKSPRLSKEVRTEAILEAARQVFEEQGYEKAKVTEIAERVDVVEGTVFHYFNSKRVLMLKVIERFYDQITGEVNEGIKGIKGTRNRLHYIIRYHLNVLNSNAALCAVILRESRGVEMEFANETHQLNRSYTNCLIKVIKDGIEFGEIREDCSPTLVRNTVYGNLEHVLWNLLTERKPINVERISEQLTELIFRGISTGVEDPEQGDVTSLIKKLNRLLDK